MGFQTIRHRTSAHGHPPGDRPCAFTVIELLAVITILLIMMALIAPAVGNMTSTAGRKGAVNVLMNAFEQARAAALERGSDVYVLLWRREFPDRDAILMMEDQVDTATGNATLIPLSKWMELPKGVLLYSSGPGQHVFKGGIPDRIEDEGSLSSTVPKKGGESPKIGDIGVVQFNASGGVPFPTNKAQSMLILAEGIRGSGGTEALFGNKRESGGFEIITWRRFTGRVTLDVSTL